MSTTSIPSIVNPDLAAELKEKKARVMDVRTPGEFESIHIPGSYNVPLDLLSKHREELSQRVKDPVILVCGTGNRSQQAESELRQAGLEEVSVLEGGISAWETEGHEVSVGQQKWTLERQVRGVAGTLVLMGTIGGYFVWRPLTFIAMFVGGGLTFSALTDFCGMARLLGKIPYNQTNRGDINEVMEKISGDRI